MQEFVKSAIAIFQENILTMYELTPCEIVEIAKAKNNKALEDIKTRITIAYYGELLARSKKLPKLDKLLKNIDKPKKKSLSKGDMVLLNMQKGY